MRSSDASAPGDYPIGAFGRSRATGRSAGALETATGPAVQKPEFVPRAIRKAIAC
jgi:hypothetical protein